jgi:hypothetical protein
MLISESGIHRPFGPGEGLDAMADQYPKKCWSMCLDGEI